MRRTDGRDVRRLCVRREVQGGRRPELVRRIVGRVGPTNPAPPSLTPQGAGLRKPTQPTDLDFPPCRKASGAQQHPAASAPLQARGGVLRDFGEGVDDLHRHPPFAVSCTLDSLSPPRTSSEQPIAPTHPTPPKPP